MRWAEQTGRVAERKGAYRVSIRKTEGKRSLGRLRPGWEDNIKIDLKEIREWCGLDCCGSGYG
jgi:hypothetical protein